MKTRKLFTLGTSLVLSLALTTACSKVNREEPINAVTLSKEYRENKPATVEKYGGKEITVAGKVEYNDGDPDKGGMLGFVGVKGGPTELTGVNCFYEGEQYVRFVGVALGKIVAVRGAFSGEKDYPKLQRCKLVEEYK